MKLLVPILAALLLFVGCEKEQEPSASSQTARTQKPRPPAPKRYLLTADHNQTRSIVITPHSATIEGSEKDVVLLLFFSSDCPACKAELEELRELYKKYGDRIDIIALQLGGEPVEAPFFVSRDMRKNYEIAKKVYPLLRAPASMPIPLLVVLKDNEYVIHYVGAAPLEMLKIDIEKALGE